MRSSFQIHGVGTAVPSHTMTQPEATKLAQQVICRTPQQEKLLSVLYRIAGVKKRHTVLPHRLALNWLPAAGDVPVGGTPDRDGIALGPTTSERMQYFAEYASPLALAAARQALQEARVEASRITHLIVVTCTGFEAPGIDTALMSGLGLRPTTQRIQVGFMGCHGAINGLCAAQALAAADPAARVLLCAVELCSLHYRFHWDEERIVANALFSDGAAAIVGSDHKLPGGVEDAWNIQATGSCLLPDSTDAMTWRIGDHGFEMTLSPRVPELIHDYLRTWLVGWLDSHGQCVESIGSWAIHPGGPRILSAVEESLGLSHDATTTSREILAEYGNMSSPTVLFVLDRLRRQEAPRPCLALGFGPGMFAEAALIIGTAESSESPGIT